MGIIEIVKKLNVGDTFYEDGYVHLELVVLTKPVKKNNTWRWTAKDISDGEEIDFGVNEKYLHYAPKIHL